MGSASGSPDGLVSAEYCRASTRLSELSSLELDPEVLRSRIVAILAEAFGWEFVALVGIDRMLLTFVCEAVASKHATEVHVGYSRPLGSGVVGRVALTGKTVLVSDADDYGDFVHTLPGGRSELCVPLTYRGDVVGALNLESTRPRAFDQQVQVVELIGGQVAALINGATVLAELRRRSQMMEAMFEVSRYAVRAADVAGLLHRLVDRLQSILALSSATVFVDGQVVGSLEVRAHVSRGAPVTHMGECWRVDHGIVGRCYRLGEVQYVSIVSRDSDYVARDSRTRSELAIPLQANGTVFGVLNVESDVEDGFDIHLRTVLRSLSDQISGAVRLRQLTSSQEGLAEQLASVRAQTDATKESLRRAVRKLRKKEVWSASAAGDDVMLLKSLDARIRRNRRNREVLAFCLIGTMDIDVLPVGTLVERVKKKFRSASDLREVVDATTVALITTDARIDDLRKAVDQLRSEDIRMAVAIVDRDQIVDVARMYAQARKLIASTDAGGLSLVDGASMGARYPRNRANRFVTVK